MSSDSNIHIFFSLSVLTELNLREGMKFIDTYGNDHPLTPHQVRVMLAVGWACFLGSWLVNIAYYKFHPSSVDVFSPQDKMELYVLGENVFTEIGRKNFLQLHVVQHIVRLVQKMKGQKEKKEEETEDCLEEVRVDVESQKDTIELTESHGLLAQSSSQARAEIQCAPEAL